MLIINNNKNQSVTNRSLESFNDKITVVDFIDEVIRKSDRK